MRFQETGRATRKIPVTLGAGEVLELGTLVSSAGGRLELEGLPPGKLSWVMVSDGEGAVSDPIELRRGERFLEVLPEGPVVVTVLTHGRATRSFETVIERGRTVVHAMDSRPGYVHQVAVTANGCAPMKYTNGVFLVGYSVEDPSGETVVASFLQAAMQPTMDLVPLAAGAVVGRFASARRLPVGSAIGMSEVLVRYETAPGLALLGARYFKDGRPLRCARARQELHPDLLR